MFGRLSSLFEAHAWLLQRFSKAIEHLAMCPLSLASQSFQTRGVPRQHLRYETCCKTFILSVTSDTCEGDAESEDAAQTIVSEIWSRRRSYTSRCTLHVVLTSLTQIWLIST